MGRRNQVPKYQVWTNMDSASPVASEKTVVDQVDVVKYVLTVDPTVVGTIEVQFSDDKNEKDEVWRALDFAQIISINGATDVNYMFLIREHSSQKMRLVFTNSGGTGNINAWISSVQVGA